MNILFSFPPFPPPATPLPDEQYNDGMYHLIGALKDIGDQIIKPINGQSSLEVLHPFNNTAAYAFALERYARLGSLSSPELFAKLTTFLHNFDARQIRYVGSQYEVIMTTTAVLAEQLDLTEAGALALSKAIFTVDPDASTFTSYHQRALNLALLSRRPQSILQLIEKPIYYFPSTSSRSSNTSNDRALSYSTDLHPSEFITCGSGFTQQLSYRHVMEYFSYIADACIQMRKWEQALDALEAVVSYPVKDTIPSKLMVDAYKRYILVHCIHHGTSSRFSVRFATISVQMAKTIRTIAKPYEILAVLFDAVIAESEPIERLTKEADEGRVIWEQDCNSGLVTLLLDQIQEYKIRNLANVYHRISIYDVPYATNMPGGSKPWSQGGTEETVLKMIAQGQIPGTIEGLDKDEVICFRSSDTLLSDEEFSALVLAATSRLTKLTEELKVTDHRLSRNPAYLQYLVRQKNKNSLANGKDSNDMNMESFNTEEDIMSDD